MAGNCSREEALHHHCFGGNCHGHRRDHRGPVGWLLRPPGVEALAAPVAGGGAGLGF